MSATKINFSRRANVEAALAKIESLRAKLISQELRTAYSQSNQAVYEFYTDLLMRLDQIQPHEGYRAKAFVVSERARARSLLEILIEARTNIRQGIDATLLEREKTIQQRLNAKAERLTRLLSGKHTEQQADDAKKELESLLNDYQQTQAQIRTNSPRYAALTQPQPVSLKEMQEQLLDKDTVLLEYALGKERSFLWAVTSTSLTAYELPKRTVIEATARRLYDLLKKGNQRELQTQLKFAAGELSGLIIAPVAEISGNKRLLIVSDGALQYIPFGVLPAPKAQASLVTGHLPLANQETKDQRQRTILR